MNDSIPSQSSQPSILESGPTKLLEQLTRDISELQNPEFFFESKSYISGERSYEYNETLDKQNIPIKSLSINFSARSVSIIEPGVQDLGPTSELPKRLEGALRRYHLMIGFIEKYPNKLAFKITISVDSGSDSGNMETIGAVKTPKAQNYDFEHIFGHTPPRTSLNTKDLTIKKDLQYSGSDYLDYSHIVWGICMSDEGLSSIDPFSSKLNSVIAKLVKQILILPSEDPKDSTKDSINGFRRFRDNNIDRIYALLRILDPTIGSAYIEVKGDQIDTKDQLNS